MASAGLSLISPCPAAAPHTGQGHRHLCPPPSTVAISLSCSSPPGTFSGVWANLHTF